MEHVHIERGRPYDHTLPITCPACKIELRAALVKNFEKSCAQHGTPFDLRIIADMLSKYE